MKAMILAAGRGERMRPLSDQTPKPLLKIGSHSLIEHHLIALEKAGIKEVVINVSFQAKMIMDQLGDGQKFNLNITYSFEENGPFGTGGGLFQALPFLGNDPFLLVSGDIMTDFDFKILMNKPIATAHLMMVENPEFHPKGDFALLNDGRLSLGEPRLTYGNIAVINPKLMADQKAGKYPLAPILQQAIKEGKVTGECFRGLWFNIGTPQQLNILKQKFA